MGMTFGDGRDWFLQRRLGLFVHWGLYATSAWHEQQQWRASVPRARYERLRDQFNPLRFDPDRWLDVAEKAGMSYICFTTKQHDGFCLWDSDETDYDVMPTPYGRDVLKILAEACHRRGFPLCLYHSVVDWHHPNYPNQGRSHELPQPEPGDEPDWARYRAYLLAQVRELCIRYGEIHGFWWDMNVTGMIDPSINGLIRKLQPSAVINDRGLDAGDFGTPERDARELGRVSPFERLTEACQSVGRESWGYRADEDYYTDRHLMAGIATTLARGGNYLLNTGPMADGMLPGEALAMVERVGEWFQRVKRSLCDAELVRADLGNRDILLSRRGNPLFICLHRPPSVQRVVLDSIGIAPQRAILLNTGQAVSWSLDELPTRRMGPDGRLISDSTPCLRLCDLPLNELSCTVPVIELEFDRAPFIGQVQLSAESGSPV